MYNNKNIKLYLTVDDIKLLIKKYETKLIENISDLFIVTYILNNDKIIFVSNDAKELLKYLNNRRIKKAYWLELYYYFLKNFSRPNNKYLKIGNVRVWKYETCIKLGSKSDIEYVNKLKNDNYVKSYLTECKINRLLK